MTTSSQCHTGRMCVTLPIITTVRTSLPIHVAHKITVICGQKIGKSEVWNLKLCSCAIWRRGEKFEHGCSAQLQIIPYKNPQKTFLELQDLIDFRCAQTLALPCAFGTTATSWQFFVAPWNDVGKYFNTDAHLQYMGYKAVVEVFFQVTSGWSKWCTQTLHPFSQILTIFSGITHPRRGRGQGHVTYFFKFWDPIRNCWTGEDRHFVFTCVSYAEARK